MIISTASFGFGGPCCNTEYDYQTKPFIVLFENYIMRFSKGYFRKKRKENYEADKELSRLYHSVETEPGESFTQFKRRRKSNFIS